MTALNLQSTGMWRWMGFMMLRIVFPTGMPENLDTDATTGSKGRWMGKVGGHFVVEQPDAYFEYRIEPCLIQRLTSGV